MTFLLRLRRDNQISLRPGIRLIENEADRDQEKIAAGRILPQPHSPDAMIL
jgi:hypothetical protein